MGGIPMYMCPVDKADVSKDEPAPDNISRVQKTLGGAFNVVWGAWVKKAALRRGGHFTKLDPKLNSVQQRSEFLQAWSKANFDAYKVDRECKLEVDRL
eukprot:6216694-Pyramimonas_sp.AAC.1